MTLIIKESLNSRLQRIADILLLNARFTSNIGLISGKMGIAIFLYNYAKMTSLDVYSDQADKLIDEVYKEIKQCQQIGFKDGLIGIGWGIEYLCRNNFVNANIDDVLEELDSIVLESRRKLPISMNLESSVFDYGLYFLSRFQNKLLNGNISESWMHYIHILVDECEGILIDNRYLKYNTPYINIELLNSIGFFLSTLKIYDIANEKVERMYKYFPSYIEVALHRNNDFIESITANLVLRKIRCINDANTLSFSNKYFDNKNTSRFDLDSIKKIGIYQLIYPTLFEEHNSSEYLKKEIVNYCIRANWECLEELIHKNQMGLNGLSGVALTLLVNFPSVLKNS